MLNWICVGCIAFIKWITYSLTSTRYVLSFFWTKENMFHKTPERTYNSNIPLKSSWEQPISVCRMKEYYLINVFIQSFSKTVSWQITKTRWSCWVTRSPGSIETAYPPVWSGRSGCPYRNHRRQRVFYESRRTS